MQIRLVSQHTSLTESVAKVLQAHGHEVEVRPDTAFESELKYRPATALAEVSQVVEQLKPLLPSVHADDGLVGADVEVRLGEAKALSSWEIKLLVDSEPLAENPALQAPLDTAEVDIALDGVKALGMGKDEIPDILTISFSGHDRIGHGFGPDAPEALREYLHIDQEIGRLLTGLDTLVGKGKYVVVLSSDHGVSPVPELAKARGLDAGRVDLGALKTLLDKELDDQLGRQDWFAGAKTPGLTFTASLRAKAQPAIERLRKLARTQPGVLDLLPIGKLEGPQGQLFARGAFVGRSPDLIVLTRPYWTYGAHDKTGHASPWLYDRAVPLVFFGLNVKRGQGGTTEPINLAPTMSRLLTIPTPAAAQGRSLDEVFR